MRRAGSGSPLGATVTHCRCGLETGSEMETLSDFHSHLIWIWICSQTLSGRGRGMVWVLAARARGCETSVFGLGSECC